MLRAPRPRALVRGLPPGLLALSALIPQLQACSGCSEQNIVSREPVAYDDTTYADLDHDWGSWLSMAVNLDNAPVVSYYDKTKGALGFATATWTADNELRWIHEQVDGYADDAGFDNGDRGKYTSLAVAADGQIWIAYQDVQNKALRYATRTAADTVWTSNVADVGGGPTPVAGLYASLALDGNGYPIVAHYDEGAGTLRVARWNGSAFAGAVVDEGDESISDTGAPVDADTGRYPSLAIVEGIEYIAYYDVANGDLKLAWGTGGNYSIETIDSEGDVGQWPNLVINEGRLHIAYHDAGNGDLKYAVGAPGSFEIQVVDDSDHVGADTKLWISGDKPNIAYFDGRNNDMKQAWPSGDGWQSRTVTEDPGALGFHNEVVIAGGQTWAGCYDYTNRTLWFRSLD